MAAAFENWESLYSFFETMFEGRHEDVALNMLHNGTTKRHVISEDGGIIHLSTLAGAPGALPAKVEGRIGSLYETIAESAVPELAQPVATYFNLSGKYTGYTPDETHLAAAVGFMLTHGTATARTIFARHAITDPSLILLSHEALRLGVPAEYIRDSSLQPSITARYGKGGYDALGLRILHERGVPAAYASALSTCRLGMLFDDPDAIASMHAAGIDAQRFAGGQLTLEHRAARMAEGHAVAFELLHDEAFTAEEARAELLLEGDAERHAFGRAQKRVLLADHRAAQLA